MRAKFGLRGRFVAAILLIVGLVSGAFGYAVWQFIELLEGELLHRTLAVELREFADNYQHDPLRPPPDSVDLKGYIAGSGKDPRFLPPPIVRNLPQGLHEDVLIENREYYIGRKDINGASLYLMLDIEAVEELERQVIAIAGVTGLLALGLATLLAVVLARVVMGPVTALAARVAALDPTTRGVRLQDQFGDQEAGVIAAALDRYLARLDALIEREQAFTQDASHELRTPLATLISGIELLQQQPDLPPLAHERLARLQRAGAQTRSVVEALLYLAREHSGPAPEACDLELIVQTAAESARDLAQQKSLELRVETAPVTVLAPSGMAACVVNNLLANAIHFTERGRVELRLSADRLTVEDSGIGIPPDDLSHIFERRFRGSASRGLGLGLYLVQRICDRLGWKVSVSSVAGAGARFEVLFGGALTKS